MARVRAMTGLTRVALDAGFWMSSTSPGAAADPSSLARLNASRIEIGAPKTAAAALRDAGAWSFEMKRDFDAEDFWFGTSFDSTALTEHERAVLRFEGLGGLAEVWLNGELLGASTDMFTALAIDVTQALRPSNELVVRCASLAEAMRQKRPRPRWKTRLVERQELRFFRQSLLGRMPGFTPPCPIVGPFGPITIERTKNLGIDARVAARLVGNDGEVKIALAVLARGGVRSARARVGDATQNLDVKGSMIEGTVHVESPARWWPHTHGAPARHAVTVEIDLDGAIATVDLGRVGFRSIEIDRKNGYFSSIVNGVRVFCRGASFVPLDVVAVASAAADVDAAVEQAAHAGMNMLRLSGTMLYGDDAFFEACDARGVLVWQDFAFANLDYPVADDAFQAAVRAEASSFLARTETNPSLAILCGGSEVFQQAAMLGLDAEARASALFSTWLPEIVVAERPDVPYVENTPSGGAMPFQVNEGVSHYYGVGAYLLPESDARRAEVKFAAECLAFSNVPAPTSLEAFLDRGVRPAHDPLWKARVPRDRGVGWDFEDVRDHYVGKLFGVDPMRVRYSDPERYLALGRVATGELMMRSFAEWRRARSPCSGALVWFLRDLWPGAGFGVVDSDGVPKAAFHYLARVLAPLAVFFSDEGQSGLFVHAVNDGAQGFSARLEIALYRNGEVVVDRAERAVDVPARGALELSVEGLFGRFVDSAYVYRFGPPAFDVAVARLVDASGKAVSEAFHLPLGLARPACDVGLEATAEATDGGYDLTVRTTRFAQAVAIDAGAFIPSDDHFNLAPGSKRTVSLTPRRKGMRLAGSVSALNGVAPVRIVVRARQGEGG